MKKFFLHTLVGVLALAGSAFAQDFPKTYTSNPCANCTPPGYTIVSGGPVALSNMTGVGGSPLKSWVNGFSNPPSSFKALDANTGNVFLTLKSSSLQQDKVKVIDVNVEKGIKYTFHYYVMTSKAHLTSATISDYATSAKLEVTATSQQGGTVPVASKTTSFTPGVNVDTWIEQTVTFVAPETHLHFELSLVGNPNQVVSYVNFDIYSKPFDCVVPTGQVELYHSTLETPFSCDLTDLMQHVKNPVIPGVSAYVVWSVTSNHGFTQMTDEELTHAKSSLIGEDYYAFYRSPNGCYNADISTSKFKFTTKPTQVSLTSNQRSINCINQTSVDLTAQVVPTNYQVRWFTDDKHQQPVVNPQTASVNTYFAFYFHAEGGNQCYSVDKAAASAIFQVTGSTMCCNDPTDPSNQIPLTQTDVKIVAPAETYDLTTLIPANISIPPNVVIEWYTTPDHSGSPVPDPKHAGPGKYYVFAHDLKNGCFNVPFSKSSVNVSKNAPQLAVRVALQGAFEFGDWDIMRNNLQTYGGAGLLPINTPYGGSEGSEVCADINDYSKMGNVIDWVKVEIRDAANPAILLESRSLILKSSGAIVNLDGTSYPYFKVQSNPVRIVVKHRNHLAIMSNPIQSFNIGVINYDFTSALSQASSLSGEPAQMIQMNGMWCMWAGDINAGGQDLGVDVSDMNQLYNSNKQAPVDIYVEPDLNMDGGVDASDVTLLYFNNLKAPYSSLVNY